MKQHTQGIYISLKKNVNMNKLLASKMAKIFRIDTLISDTGTWVATTSWKKYLRCSQKVI